jgi:uroporphyrinogen III methyltransferase/synthase
LLEQADVVLHDALSHPALLDYCERAEIRDVGKRFGQRSPPQQFITDQLIELARAGKRVVRLKGGDPYLFARGAEEALSLVAAGIPFEVVPGLSSPVATAAYAGIPLTHRDLSSSVTFITGSDREGKQWSPGAWEKLATATDTICVLMGMRRIEEIVRAIVAGGRDPGCPCAVVQWGARPEQRVVTAPLRDIAARCRGEGVTNPAVIIIGSVVELRGELRFFDNQPLFGRRVLVPRASHQAGATARALRWRAAQPISFPVIEIAPPPDSAALARAARAAGEYDWIVFTSANGVERFFQALVAEGLDARALGRARVAAIGPKTAAELEPYGIKADLTAREFVGEALAAELVQRGSPGRVLLPRALVAREELPELLRARGFQVDVVAAYETRPVGSARSDELAGWLRAGGLDAILFTSTSTVTNLVATLGADAPALLASVTLASIGPITTGALERAGLCADVQAEVYTVEGLLDALEQHFRAAG